MRHYTRDEKLKAMQLYIQYGKSPAAVRYELGYPTKTVYTFGIKSILGITTVSLKIRYDIPNFLLSSAKQLLIIT